MGKYREKVGEIYLEKDTQRSGMVKSERNREKQ